MAKLQEGSYSYDLAQHDLTSPQGLLQDRKAAFLSSFQRDYGYGEAYRYQDGLSSVHDRAYMGKTKDYSNPMGLAHPSAYQAARTEPEACLTDHRLAIDVIREAELTRLHGRAYLDHGGSALYSERQLEAAMREMATTLMVNPHSGR